MDCALCVQQCNIIRNQYYTVAVTVVVESPLPVLLHVQEPPSNPPPLSHLQHLSTFSDWRGLQPRYNYFIALLLQPGINHITWCKGDATGMEASFFPPLYGDWPTISPHPISSQHDLNFYNLSCESQNYHLTKVGYPCPDYLSFPVFRSKQPPILAHYYVKGTVPSLRIMASIAVIGQGYLLPHKESVFKIPHRLIDETYHPLRICLEDGTIIH
jgi:hypothetical protein